MAEFSDVRKLSALLLEASRVLMKYVPFDLNDAPDADELPNRLLRAALEVDPPKKQKAVTSDEPIGNAVDWSKPNPLGIPDRYNADGTVKVDRRQPAMAEQEKKIKVTLVGGPRHGLVMEVTEGVDKITMPTHRSGSLGHVVYHRRDDGRFYTAEPPLKAASIGFAPVMPDASAIVNHYVCESCKTAIRLEPGDSVQCWKCHSVYVRKMREGEAINEDHLKGQLEADRQRFLASGRRVLCNKGCCFECEECSSKPGSPELCKSCLELRTLCNTVKSDDPAVVERKINFREFI